MSALAQTDLRWVSEATRRIMDKHAITNGDFVADALRDAILYARRQPAGEVAVTINEAGECVAVTRQDKEHRIISVIWRKP